MLFLLFGSSAAGKTIALDGVAERVPGLAAHDFDEIGVPRDADTAWRQRANETWLRRAVELQERGTDLLLAAQTPLGEILAAPSVTELDGLSACLLDCDDTTRLERIRARGPEWLERVPGDLESHLAWAEWMRRHAIDPRWRQEVIRGPGVEEMRWNRWDMWSAGDPRWRVRVLDTSDLSPDQVADELTEWIERERDVMSAGSHPLGAAALQRLDRHESASSLRSGA